MEDNLDVKEMEEDLNLQVNGSQSQFVGSLQMISMFGKGKMTIMFCCFKWKMTTVSYKVKLAQLAIASPELGKAQPQLVFVIYYSTT